MAVAAAQSTEEPIFDKQLGLTYAHQDAIKVGHLYTQPIKSLDEAIAEEDGPAEVSIVKKSSETIVAE